MNDFAQLDALHAKDTEKLSLKSERRVDSSALSIHHSANHTSHLQRLMAKLQNQFSDSVDVAYLIETEVKHRTADLAKRANYDSITHLPNRAYFHDMLEDLIQKSKQNALPFSLLFLDLDGFKRVNDSLGHHIGDELLRHVSGRMVAAVREGDIVSRLGGDEFVILLAELNQRSEIKTICRRIIDEVAKSYWLDGHEVRTSASIGIAIYPNDTVISSELIEKADQALYVSKTGGKQIFRFYEEVQQQLFEQTHKNLTDFEKDVSEGRFHIEIEPQIDLKQNRMVGGMMVPYWTQEGGKKIAFPDWESLLVQSGKGMSVATWLLDSACFYAKKWTIVDAEFVVTVPILDALALRDDLVTLLIDKLQHAQLMPNQCQFAFSMEQLEKQDGMAKKLAALSAAGGQITLTGLGANGLNLEALSALSVQEFKFDEAWLQQAMQTSSGQKWVQALIQLGKSLDACMIATGISSEVEANQLKSWGCQLAQGGYWSPAIGCEQFDINNF